MLSSLHKITSSFFMKVFLALLVASFALWGIGDVFRSSDGGSVVRVGESRVSAQEFHDELTRELANYRSILGDQYNVELLRAMNVPEQVLERLIQQHLVQEEGRALGLVVPESYLAEQVRDNPAFHGEDDKFDRATFNRVLTSNNFTEKRYLDLLGRELTANTLLQGAFSGIYVPEAAAELAYRFEQERRTADILIFPAGIVKDIPAPTDEQLQHYHREHIERFIAPELRSFSVIALDAEGLAKTITFSDDDLLVEYQKRIDQYQEPEKREVKQLLFTDEESARKAHAAIVAGKSLEEAGKTFGAVNPNLLLGDVTASGVIPEAEKDVFALEKNAYTDPLQSSFGWHIFQVLSIQPRHTRPLNEVKDALIETLRAERLGDELYNLSATLQDELAAGASVEDAARRANAGVRHFGPLDAAGKDADGKAAALPEGYDDLLPSVFALNEGETSSILETKDGSYYAVNLTSVQPSAEKPLEAVRTEAAEGWKSLERSRRLLELANDAVDGLKETGAAEVARKSGAKLLAGKELQRGNVDLGEGRVAPPAFLAALFTLKPGEVSAPYQISAQDYAVGRLVSVKPADISENSAKAGVENARQNLRGIYADELYLAYLNYLRGKHSVSRVNEALLNDIVQQQQP